MPLYHIVSRREWERRPPGALYEPISLRMDGFIHLSTARQLLKTAERHFAEHEDLLVISIDEQELTGPLRYEEVDGEVFPHLYGPLEPRAIIEVVALPKLNDGSFYLPDEWRPWASYF